LLSQGYLFCELQSLAVSEAMRLLDQANRFAHRTIGVATPSTILVERFCAGFSNN